MRRLLKIALALGVVSSFALCAQVVKSADSSAQTPIQANASSKPKVMREFKGIKLGAKRDQVHTSLGKPESSSDTSEDYKLTGDDSMTVHYENGEVRAIQLAFLDAKNAPAWADVVGDAEINETESGAKHARKVVAGENFWVSIYQSKDGSITRITMSR
jgi:hypothetical protein